MTPSPLSPRSWGRCPHTPTRERRPLDPPLGDLRNAFQIKLSIAWTLGGFFHQIIRIERKISLFSLFFLLSFSSLSLAQMLTPEEELQQAVNTYEYNTDYAKAIQLFRKLLYPKPGLLRSREQRGRAYKYLAFSYFQERKRFKDHEAAQRRQYLRLAREHLEEYLRINPTQKSLDPAYNPPDLVTFFARVRSDLIKKLPGLSASEPTPQIQTQILTLTLKERVQYGNPFLIPLPFGAPQFANGHLLKASLLAGGSLIAISLNITGYLVVNSLVIKSGAGAGRFAPADLQAATAWQIVQFSSIGLFAGLWIYGIIDGSLYYQSRRTTLLPELPKLDPGQFRIAAFR